MQTQTGEKLALHGGEKVIREPFPGGHVTRSLIDEREVEAVAEVTARQTCSLRLPNHSECTILRQTSLSPKYGVVNWHPT